MKGWRQAFDRIGGPDAVTWVAFSITLVASLIGNLTTGGEISISIVTRVAIIVVTQIIMFIPLVILRFTLLRDPDKSRPWIALAGFVLAAFIRGIVLTWLLVTAGAVTEPRLAYRIAASFQSQTVLLIIIALVMGTFRAQARSLEQLEGLQRQLEETQERIREEVTGRNEEVLAQVKQRLSDELSALEQTEGAASVAELQRLASDVVRPMSHDLAASLPQRHEEANARSLSRVTWSSIMNQMTRSTALHPVQNGLLMLMVMVVASLGIFGRQGLLLIALIVGSVVLCSWLANRVLLLFLPRLSPQSGVVVLFTTSLIVGLLSSGSAAMTLDDGDFRWVFFLAGGIFVFGIVILIALANAILQEQSQSEQLLKTLTAQLQREVVRLRQAQWLQGKALSRALHGPVQSAVTSAALRLDTAVRTDLPTDGIVEDIRNDLRTMIDVLDVDEVLVPSFDLAVSRITGTWEGVCSVDVEVSATALQCVGQDSLARSTVIDVFTEAVSNAVRHGGATHVQMSLDCAPENELVLTVTNDGNKEESAHSAPGLGTRLLDECALTWSRHRDPEHVLQVVIPAGSSS